MRAILPGQPQRRFNSVATGVWRDRQIIAYVTGNAFVVLDTLQNLLQTTYQQRDDELVAIAFDETHGKIAVACSSAIYVYSTHARDDGRPAWELHCSTVICGDAHGLDALSWGLDHELLAAGTELALFTTRDALEVLWSKPLANPVKFAEFSHDTSLISTTGYHDRLVKIWRRLSSASESMDFSYLPHPQAVTSFSWRRPYHHDQTAENILYTLCADRKLRIWSPGDLQAPQILKLWEVVDLTASLYNDPSRSMPPSDRQFVCILNSGTLAAATERAVQQENDTQNGNDSLDQLIQVASRGADVVIVTDDCGHTAALGLEAVGGANRKPGDIFRITDSDDLDFRLRKGTDSTTENAQIYGFCGRTPTCTLGFLIHHFDGRLELYGARAQQFLNARKIRSKLTLLVSWTGHRTAVRQIIRTPSGKALVSRTQDDNVAVWKQEIGANTQALECRSRFRASDPVIRVWLLREGEFTVLLSREFISLWNTRRHQAFQVARLPYKLHGEPLCLIGIPREQESDHEWHLATISSEMDGVSWEIHLPRSDGTGTEQASLVEFDHFSLGNNKEFAYMIPVDPAGSLTTTSGFFDTFARDVICSWTTSGVVNMWAGRTDRQRRTTEWLNTNTIETSINSPSLGSATSTRKAALIDEKKTSMSIWNTRSSQLEYEQEFPTAVRNLDWSSSPGNQSTLAVGFDHRVLIYAQSRYDYLDARPPWAVIREIDIGALTSHPIGDLVWISHGYLVIGSGNQLFVEDNLVELSQSLRTDLRLLANNRHGCDFFTILARLNGPLPVYHPQLLGQCILSGKLLFVQRILCRLWETLKLSESSNEIESTLGFQPADFSLTDDNWTARDHTQTMIADQGNTYNRHTILSEEVQVSLNEHLTMHQIPYLSSREQLHLIDIVECVSTTEAQRRSIDTNGCRFIAFFRQHLLRSNEREHEDVSWREIVWAFHSTGQGILKDLVTQYMKGNMQWKQARECGIFMWMTDAIALRAQFELVARNQYTKTEMKDPVDCSLFYMALRKKNVVLGLWRMAGWHREHAATQRLLANNFEETRWKDVAMKNAYALMGKRRFEYAAAFFLLADNLKTAIGVLHNQLDDVQLAVAVARVYEGDNGPVLTELLETRVLPQAVQAGNRWLATWAFWMLGQREKAVQALILPLSHLVKAKYTPNLQSKIYLADDPALVVLYQQLREKSPQMLRAALSISPRAEWKFVMHNARLYERMGCDVLALDLVRSWEFLKVEPARSQASLNNSISSSVMRKGSWSEQLFSAPLASQSSDPRKLLRRRSSLVVADLPVDQFYDQDTSSTVQGSSILENTAEGCAETEESIDNASSNESKEKPQQNGFFATKKRPAMEYKEPDAQSLLDAFGF